LAFWTGGDVGQMDRLFRQSGLMRDKWDEVHFADGSTYGEKTLERAVTRVDEFYEPSTTTSGSPPNPRERGGPPGAETAGEQSTAGMTSREHREQRLLGLLDRLEARIAVLEAENDELREELAWRRSESERREEPTEQPSDDEPSGSVSRWAWLPARFRKS
jgi:primase-polymerase (primpol)-like protein